MATVRIGTVDLPQKGGWEGYFKRLDYLELSGLFAGPIKPGTLTRWAETAAPGSLGLIAPWIITHENSPTRAAGTWTQVPGGGEFRDSVACKAGLAALASAAATVSAHLVAFQSPDMMSPSAHNRDVLRKFFAEVAPAEMFGTVERVWLPSGLWTAASAIIFAAELGVTCSIDPLLDDPDLPVERLVDLPATRLYMRPFGMGRAGTLSADRLDTLASLVDCYESTTIAFGTAERFRDASNFTKLLDPNNN